MTLGLGKKKMKKSRKDYLYRGHWPLPLHIHFAVPALKPKGVGPCVVCLLCSLALTLGQALGAQDKGGISDQPSLVDRAWEGG